MSELATSFQNSFSLLAAIWAIFLGFNVHVFTPHGEGVPVAQAAELLILDDDEGWRNPPDRGNAQAAPTMAAPAFDPNNVPLLDDDGDVPHVQPANERMLLESDSEVGDEEPLNFQEEPFAAGGGADQDADMQALDPDELFGGHLALEHLDLAEAIADVERTAAETEMARIEAEIEQAEWEATQAGYGEPAVVDSK